MIDFVLPLVSAALLNNFVLHWPLGVDPLLQARPAAGKRLTLHAQGIATSALMLVTTLISHSLYHYLLLPLGLEAFKLFVFLPTSVLLIGPLLSLLARGLPRLPFGGLTTPLLGNAGILGLSLLNAADDKGLIQALLTSLGAGLGFWLVLGLFSDLRQRTFHEEVPQPFRGLPIDLIGAGLIGVAFLGFTALVKP
ncbi:Rnf-Nqr domain containing protein [Pseudomonas sp. MWU13-2105]|uniref:Rnf-Nqr domain containing protein n=1 Tax=Pseudomonas sp. MWU13-2105 TaxID=2935074 RepID=UPI00200F7FC7|nr:Rnf-Nqr domain containing protein [Pseudomonas sp. MWU13-2105]